MEFPFEIVCQASRPMTRSVCHFQLGWLIGPRSRCGLIRPVRSSFWPHVNISYLGEHKSILSGKLVFLIGKIVGILKFCSKFAKICKIESGIFLASDVSESYLDKTVSSHKLYRAGHILCTLFSGNCRLNKLSRKLELNWNFDFSAIQMMYIIGEKDVIFAF